MSTTPSTRFALRDDLLASYGTELIDWLTLSDERNLVSAYVAGVNHLHSSHVS